MDKKQENKNRDKQSNQLQTDTPHSDTKENWTSRQKQFDMLASKLSNRVLLDTLLERITSQQNVKILTNLTEEKKASADLTTTYSGDGYTFQMKIKKYSEEFTQNVSTFIDGKKKIAFENYKITCYNNHNYICDDYGFNTRHYLIEPKIIEIGGLKFLYSDIGFPCNGIGCGQKLTMIYDLKEKKPTFVSNYRLPFDKFLLSDFNNDSIPDLLVIAKTPVQKIKGTDVQGFSMKILVYTYNQGIFKLNKNIYYNLQGIGDLYHEEPAFSIETDCWFKNIFKM